jgi:hypothetical protein
MTAMNVPGETLKLQVVVKSGRTEQSGIIKKIPNTQPAECPKTPLYSRPAGREIDRTRCAVRQENNKRYQENPQLYRTRQE